MGYLDPILQLAVHLDDHRHGLVGEQPQVCNRPWPGVDVVAVAALVGLGGEVGGERREKLQERVDRLFDHEAVGAGAGVTRDRVVQLHAGRDGGVEAVAVDVGRHAGDGAVDRPPELVAVPGATGFSPLLDDVSRIGGEAPHPSQIARAALENLLGLLVPVDVVHRRPDILRPESGVAESPSKKAGVEQVQDRVGDPADVLVDRHVVTGGRDVDRAGLLVRVAKAQEVPRRVHEGVHRVGLAERRATADGAGRLQEPLVEAERRLACGPELDVLGQKDRQLVCWDGHDPVIRAVDDRDGAAPVALATYQPVPQPVVDLARTDASALEELDRRSLCCGHVEAIEETAVDLLAVARVGAPAKAVRRLNCAHDR